MWAISMSKPAKRIAIKRQKRKSNAGRKPTAAPPLRPISAVGGKSIERQAYDALRFALMTGAILPGQMLTSRSLSTALAVSSTPIIAALKRLEADGALESKSKSAFYVKDPNQKEFRDILDIRLNLEMLAVKAAAKHVTPADMKKLRTLNSSYEQHMNSAEKSSSVLEQNFRFHFEIYRLSASDVLVEMIETLWLRIGPSLHRYVGFAEIKGTPNIHGEILAALEKRNGEAAAAALRKDLESAFKLVLPLLPK
jgi:GntR family transcriptional regulator, colanic acid and biofilm gene transcriptional regulator